MNFFRECFQICENLFSKERTRIKLCDKMISPSHISPSPSTMVLPIELDKHPINCDKVLKMKPTLKINRENNTFKLSMNIAGFKSDDISVFAGNGKIAVKAVAKANLTNLNICKVYKAEYTLPIGAVIEKLRKKYQNDVLCIRGEIEKEVPRTKQ